MNYKETICDKCNEKFVIKELLTRKVKKDIKEMYFVCPKCGAEYRVTYTNQESRELQKEIEELREQIRKNPKNAEKLYKKLQKKVNRHKRLMEDLIKDMEA